MLTAEDTARIAADLIGRSTHAVDKLKQEGSCDISYSLPQVARFRVNIFTQRGSCAIVMRVIANSVPDFKTLNLPPQLGRSGRTRARAWCWSPGPRAAANPPRWPPS